MGRVIRGRVDTRVSQIGEGFTVTRNGVGDVTVTFPRHPLWQRLVWWFDRTFCTGKFGP